MSRKPKQLRGRCSCTKYDGGGGGYAAYVRCMMYDVRLRSSRALRGDLAKPGRTRCPGDVIGDGSKGAVAATPPMYDV